MTNYFPHDYNARTDPKLQELLMEHGVAGLGVYWCVIEMLYEQNGRIPTKSIKGIAYTLHVDAKDVESVIHDFSLFEFDDDMFYSKSVDRRLAAREKISNKRKKAIEARWERQREIQMYNKSNTNVSKEDTFVSVADTNVLQTEYTSNTIKRKEIKEKENKEKIDKDIVVVDDAHARTIEDFRTDVFNSQITIENLCRSLKIDKVECLQLIEETLSDWQVSQETDITRKHLLNTMRIKASASKRQTPTSSYEENKAKREQAAMRLLQEY